MKDQGDLPESMRAAVYYGKGDVRFEEGLALPEPAAAELLLRVGTVGVCGSDVGEYVHGPKQYPTEVRHPHTGHLGPVIPGHEFSGTVVGIGEGVPADWLGENVASCGSVCCGHCPACLRGESNSCATYSGVGLHRNGALAGYVTVPVEACIATNRFGLSLDEAALCQPMSIAVHNVRRAGDVSGETVLLTGAGGIGAFLVYVLTQFGARVVVVDRDADRLAIAAELGAYRTVQVDGSDDSERVSAAIEGENVRFFFEASGAQGPLEMILRLSPKGARIVVIGVQHRDISVDFSEITLKEKALIGTNALVRETDFPTAVELVSRRRGQWRVVAPRVLPLRGLVTDALIPMSEGRSPAIKLLIDPWSDEERDLEAAEA